MIPANVEIFVSLDPVSLPMSFDRLAGTVTELMARSLRAGGYSGPGPHLRAGLRGRGDVLGQHLRPEHGAKGIAAKGDAGAIFWQRRRRRVRVQEERHHGEVQCDGSGDTGVRR